jgi:hypothetical protein
MALTPYPGGFENVFGIIEDDIDAAPLLEHRESAADQKHFKQSRFKQITKTALSTTVFVQGIFHIANFIVSVGFPADAAQDRSGLVAQSTLDQPARAFRKNNRTDEEGNRGHYHSDKHPAPAMLDHSMNYV